MTGDDLVTVTMRELGEPNPAVTGFYSRAECLAALVQAERLFALATLCLEKTGVLTLAIGQNYITPAATLTDYLLPLRLEHNLETQKGLLEAGSPSSLSAFGPWWEQEEGVPLHYASIGYSLLAIHPHPAGEEHSLKLTYAAMPTSFTDAAESSPSIPAEYHGVLPDFAVPRCRMKEGGTEFKASVSKMRDFWRAARQCAIGQKERIRGTGYDQGPAETWYQKLDLGKWPLGE